MSNKILLVDDEQEILNVLSFILKSEGFDVEEAINGVEAWDIMRMKSFDAIICDLCMPKLNGINLLKRVRAENKLTPFIFLSGHAGTKEELEVTSFGAYELIHKPHINLVLPALEKLLKVHEEIKNMEKTGGECSEFLNLLHGTDKKVG